MVLRRDIPVPVRDTANEEAMSSVHDASTMCGTAASHSFSHDTTAAPTGDKVPKHHILTVHTSKLFDSKSKRFLRNISLSIDLKSGLISKVTTRTSDSIPSTTTAEHTLDLRGKTVLPGFVDAHTHIFLHGFAETPSINQERDENPIERIVRATNHCRDALKAGYTTYRDLGTEGLSDADVGIRDAINRGIIPGPRLFVATEALASSGGYAIRYESRLGGTQVPRLSEPCDGVDGVSAAVRRRIGAGADVIKFYADYRRRTLRFPESNCPGCCPILHPPESSDPLMTKANPVSVLFKQAEMDAIVEEAKRAGAPVAAHAISPEAVMMAARAGVTTVEHGIMPSDEALAVMKEKGTIFVPTLAVLDLYRKEAGEELFWKVVGQTKKAFDMGVRVATGGDTGAFPHGQNAREMELMVEVGVPVVDVLEAATMGGWEACGGDLCGRKFGWLDVGWSADLVAIDGDVEKEEFQKVIRKIDVVVKDGKVFVKDGKIVD